MVIQRNEDKEKWRLVNRRHNTSMGPRAGAIHPLCSTLPRLPNDSTFWLIGNLVSERSVCERRNCCHRRKRDRRESMVGEVKAFPTFAYPYDEAR